MCRDLVNFADVRVNKFHATHDVGDVSNEKIDVSDDIFHATNVESDVTKHTSRAIIIAADVN